jgi:hypothetical protein
VRRSNDADTSVDEFRLLSERGGLFPRPVRWRRQRPKLALLLLLLLLVAGSVYVISRDGSSQVLTWAPPGYPGYSGYASVTLSSSGGTLELDDDKNYRLIPPSTPIEGHTDVRGGRNIVTMGGHCHIPDRGYGASATSRRCLTFRDDGGETSGRILHIEGWYADGPDLTEGINLATPSAIVQIQNVRIERVVARGHEDLADLDAYDGKGSHPDLLQPFGGAKEIRVDKFTGRSGYQHFWLRWNPPTNPPVHDKRYFFRRVNTEAVSYVAADDGKTYYGHSGWGWYRYESPQLFLEDGTVWHRHHPLASTATFKGSFQNKEWTEDRNPDYEPQIAADSTGTYGYYLDKAINANGRPAVRNFDDSAAGRVYSGIPPGGDYVPKGSIGIGYASPGYGYTGPGQASGRWWSWLATT